jgi:hypothetical protein
MSVPTLWSTTVQAGFLQAFSIMASDKGIALIDATINGKQSEVERLLGEGWLLAFLFCCWD